jgi:hypothetical protein
MSVRARLTQNTKRMFISLAEMARRFDFFKNNPMQSSLHDLLDGRSAAAWEGGELVRFGRRQPNRRRKSYLRADSTWPAVSLTTLSPDRRLDLSFCPDVFIDDHA